MSTRATYQVEGYNTKATLYIHHDGYEQGAACYFYNAIKNGGENGGFLEKMIRGNTKAEVTESHEIHSDTEYRYNVVVKEKVHFLTAYKREYDKNNNQIFSSIYSGNLNEFINKNNDMIENFSFVTEKLELVAGLYEKITNKIEKAEKMILENAVSNAASELSDIWKSIISFEKTSKKNDFNDTEQIDYWRKRITQHTTYFVMKHEQVKDITLSEAISNWNKIQYQVK